MEFLTEKEKIRIKDTINSQEGQPYPCGNQHVVCGFVGWKIQWNEFCRSNNTKLKYITKDWVEFENGEKWYYFNIDNGFHFRGRRFYKIKVSGLIDRDIFLQCIYPCCGGYCKELEWI